MDKLLVKKNKPVSGEVKISKAKNAYLPILAGVLLSPQKIILRDIPNLRDIKTMFKLLENLGVKITKLEDHDDCKNFEIDASNLTSHEANYELVKTMRASIFTLGPLLARTKNAIVSLPGGCSIGTRPIDIHLDGLKKLGAKIELKSGYVEASCEQLTGNLVVLPFPSVGATENIMMAAIMAQGETVIENAAREPEVEDLGNFLIAMGAKIEGLGTAQIKIQGDTSLTEVDYTAIGDRIEAGTYIMTALMTDSDIKITGFDPSHLKFVLSCLKDAGAILEIGDDFVHVKKSTLKPMKIDTAPYPGFPTDLQAQMMSLMTSIDGSSVISEHIFENRFMHVPELIRLGANITLKGVSAIIEGSSLAGTMTGTQVMCTDLRASAALVMAALKCEGESLIHRIYHLDRGYEQLEIKLQNLGYDIKRVD